MGLLDIILAICENFPLGRISKVPEDAFDGWELEHEAEISVFLAALAHRNEGQDTFTSRAVPDKALTVDGVTEAEHKSPEGEPTGESAARSGNTAQPVTSTDRVLRVSAENLNHLLGLAGVCVLCVNLGRVTIEPSCMNPKLWLWLFPPIKASSPIYKVRTIAVAFQNIVAHEPRSLKSQIRPQRIGPVPEHFRSSI